MHQLPVLGKHLEGHHKVLLAYANKIAHLVNELLRSSFLHLHHFFGNLAVLRIVLVLKRCSSFMIELLLRLFKDCVCLDSDEIEQH